MQETKIYRRNKDEFIYNFAEQIRGLRTNSSLSIEELSLRSNISMASLKKMELGHFNDWEKIFRLARFYDKKIRLEFY